MHPVDNYILASSSPEREIMDYLHNLFLRVGLTSKLSYGLPFYYGKKWVCYLHPLKEGGVELCFTRAHEFEDPTGLLQIKTRKRIKGITLRTLDEIPEAALYEILEAALAIDRTT